MTDHPSPSERSRAAQSTPRGWSSAAGFALPGTLPLDAGKRRHFSTEIAARPVDAFAERKADEAARLDGRADRAFALLECLGDALLVVEDEWLLQQADFLVEGLEPRLDDLVDHVRRLTLRLGLVGQHVALALHRRGIEAWRIDGLWIGRGDLHRHLPSNRL